MKRMIVVSICLLLLASCGGSKGNLDDLQRSNEDLTRRVKLLEDELLQANKKLIQHDQALKMMYERVRDMENAVDKFQTGPAPAR
jgi:cell division protein FtsB